MVGAVQTTETSGSGGSAKTTKTEHECTSEGRNSVTGHKHIAKRYLLRVNDHKTEIRYGLRVGWSLTRFAASPRKI